MESSDSTQFLESFDPELRRAFEFADQTVDPALVDHSKIKMHKDSIKLSGDGTFYTLQGEGPTLGLPCVFVRLHVCNLKCTWCDAWYTWNPNTPEFWTEGKDVPFEECVKLIQDTWAGPTLKPFLANENQLGFRRIYQRVIWTGGEPLIQRKQIEQVMHLLGEFWIHEFETNGTLMPTKYQLETAQFNCSPKLRNSDNRVGSMVKPKVLEALNNSNTTFKFVVMSNSDLDEIQELYSPYIDHDKIIIMPQGITEEEVSATAKNIVEECKRRGLRLMPRAQTIYWDGARRGV